MLNSASFLTDHLYILRYQNFPTNTDGKCCDTINISTHLYNTTKYNSGLIITVLSQLHVTHSSLNSTYDLTLLKSDKTNILNLTSVTKLNKE